MGRFGSTFAANWRTIPSSSATRAPNHQNDFDPDARILAGAGGKTSQQQREGHPLQVLVRDNNIDQALRVLKKKMQREGVFREMKQRKSYEKPSERKNREKGEAIRRARKLARKKA